MGHTTLFVLCSLNPLISPILPPTQSPHRSLIRMLAYLSVIPEDLHRSILCLRGCGGSMAIPLSLKTYQQHAGVARAHVHFHLPCLPDDGSVVRNCPSVSRYMGWVSRRLWHLPNGCLVWDRCNLDWGFSRHGQGTRQPQTRSLTNGRLYHHLAVLARLHAIRSPRPCVPGSCPSMRQLATASSLCSILS